LEGAEGEKDTEQIGVLKLSGKRTTVGNSSGETSVEGHRRGKSVNGLAGNLSGKGTGGIRSMRISLFCLGGGKII